MSGRKSPIRSTKHFASQASWVVRTPYAGDDWESLDAAWAWQPFEPDGDRPWDATRARHLIRRAGFGATPTQIEQAVADGHDSTLDTILSGSTDARYERETAILADAIGPRREAEANVALWLYRMLHSPHQLLEKTTLFWHGHFATSAAKVTNPKLMLDQNELLRKHALGQFEPMVQEISRDPAMLIYLDSTDNRKTHPNENYARELMELFCLGVGNYTEQDIQEVARCFTGWEVRRERFRFNSNQHDTGVKTFLGQSDAQNGDEAVGVILQEESATRFIATKLMRYFLADVDRFPDPILQPLANHLRETDFDIRSTIAMILGSNLMQSDVCRGAKVRSPLELAIGTMRTLDASANLYALGDALNEQGQKPLYPPNVKGWDGGKTWINSSTMLSRSNMVHELATSDESKFADGNLEGWLDRHDVRGIRDTVSFLLEQLVPVEVPGDVRRSLENLGREQAGNRNRQAQRLLSAIGAMPEFHLM